MMQIITLMLLAAATDGSPSGDETAAPPETPALETATTTTSARLFDDVLRARQACHYRDDTWKCVGLQAANVVATVDTDHPQGMTAAATPLFDSDGTALRDCIRSLAFSLQHPTMEAIVDWSRTSLTVDGVAVQ